MDKIKVRHRQQTMFFPLNANGKLKFTTLKQYFPHALGLTFVDSTGATIALEIIQGEILINPEQDLYDVFIPQADSPSTGNKDKCKLVKELLSRISESKEQQDSLGNLCPDTAVINTKIQKMPLQTQAEKTIHIGWLRKVKLGEKYCQVKNPLGGKVPLTLQSSHKYFVDDIKNMALQLFISKTSQEMFTDCQISLGLFDGSILSAFTTPKGEACHLWEYCQSRKMAPCRILLYLLTSPKDTSENTSQSSPCTTTPDSMTVSSVDRPVENCKSCPGEFQDDREFKRHELKEKKNAIHPPERDNQIETERHLLDNDSIVPPLDSLETSMGIIPEKNGQKQTKPNSSQSYKLISRRFDLGFHNSMIKKIRSNGESDVEIYFHIIKTSKYTQDPSVVELNKEDLYANAKYDVHPRVSIDEFDPFAEGHPVSRIVFRGEELLRIEVDDTLKKKYFFLSNEPDNDSQPHRMIYDVDFFNGYYDGKFGIGVIPNCVDSCKPIFSWYLNGRLIRKGWNLYWLTDVAAPTPGTPQVYMCIVSCCRRDSDHLILPKTVNNATCTENNDTKDSHFLMELSIPLLARQEFTLSKRLLGAGAQGKVREGDWLGTQVAVKSMPLSTRKLKFTTRELSIIEHIRHPNIIQVLALCIESQQIHILMELFIAYPLSEIIFDEEVKAEYNMDNIEKKHRIGHQVCQAIAYLHSQHNPIIHRDIKPDNILVNSAGVVKLCDLSLSKFTGSATAMRTTVGVKMGKGTPMYMAPELFLKKAESSIFSDTWSLGCTLTELYSEKSVWDLESMDGDGGQNLQKLLMEKMKPDLSCVPSEIQPIIFQCFEYDWNLRPLIKDVLENLKKLLPME